MNNSILKTIEKYDMLRRGDSVVVGVSGGADSVCLLHFLSLIRDSYDIVVKAVHVNHNIRGEEAERDELFVRSLCEELSVDLTVESVDVPSLARKLKIGEEECGRAVRYSAFEKAGCSKIAVAHTASDSVETVIFNMSRGSGLKGVSGIPPVRNNIIRPLIELTRAEVEEYCDENGLSYVIDSTNLETEYSRNKIRSIVIPALKEINPGFEENLSRFSHIAAEEDRFISKLSDEAYRSVLTGDGVSRDRLSEFDDVIRRRVVSLMLSGASVDYDHKTVMLCLEAISRRKKHELSKDLFFDASGDVISIRTAPEAQEPWEIKADDELTVTPFGSFRFRYMSANEVSKEQRGNAFDADKVDFDSLFFRSRRTGDRFSDPVRHNTKTVKKLFTESGIPYYEKNSIPILACGDDVVWIRGYRTDSKYSLTDRSSRAIVILEEQP